MNGNIQRSFIRFLRYKKNCIACDEVTTYYGCISDVIAVDLNKGIVMEYEFKNNIADLKRDFKKDKFKPQGKAGSGFLIRDRKIIPKVRKDPLRPHRFYFVVPEKLYDDNKEYLESLKDIGIVTYDQEGGDFFYIKRCNTKKSRTYKASVVERHILKRLNSIYVNEIYKWWESK